MTTNNIKIEYGDDYREITIPLNEDTEFYAYYSVKPDGRLKDKSDSDLNDFIKYEFNKLISPCLEDKFCYDIAINIIKIVSFEDKLKVIFDHYKKELENTLNEINCYIDYPNISDLCMKGNKLKDIQRLAYLYDEDLWIKKSFEGYNKLSEQLKLGKEKFENVDDYIDWRGNNIDAYNYYMRNLQIYTNKIYEIIVYSFIQNL